MSNKGTFRLVSGVISIVVATIIVTTADIGLGWKILSWFGVTDIWSTVSKVIADEWL